MEPWKLCIVEINALMKELDIEAMSTAWKSIRDSAEEVKACLICLKQLMPSVKRRDVAQEISRAKGRVNSVFREQLVECEKLRDYGNQCTSMLECLKEDIKFRHMDLEEFLEACDLEQDYALLFQDDEVAKAMEVLDMDFTSNEMRIFFKINMQDGDFKKLMDKIDLAEAKHLYITDPDHMESDLIKMGRHTKEASRVITGKLVNSLGDTRDVLGKVVKYLEAKKEAASALTGAFAWIGVAGVVLLTGGAGLIVGGSALTGALIAYLETEKLTERLAKTKETMSNWESRLGKSITQWQVLVVKFKELVNLLKESGVKLRQEELHDMGVAISDTERALRKFVAEVADYEVLVRDVIKL